MKGVLFSFILIVTMLSMVLFISVQRGLVYSNSERLAADTRINSMLNFYNSIVSDGGKALDIITKRAVSSAINHIITTGTGLQQANETIRELVVNGSIDGVLQYLMQNSTIIDWKGRMEALGIGEGFDVNISFIDVKVKPYDSWNILVSTIQEGWQT